MIIFKIKAIHFYWVKQQNKKIINLRSGKLCLVLKYFICSNIIVDMHRYEEIYWNGINCIKKIEIWHLICQNLYSLPAHIIGRIFYLLKVGNVILRQSWILVVCFVSVLLSCCSKWNSNLRNSFISITIAFTIFSMLFYLDVLSIFVCIIQNTDEFVEELRYWL